LNAKIKEQLNQEPREQTIPQNSDLNLIIRPKNKDAFDIYEFSRLLHKLDLEESNPAIISDTPKFATDKVLYTSLESEIWVGQVL
jgi:hypothetical protein